MLNKKDIFAKILQQLNTELATLQRATEDAHAAATHEETQAKSKYDTFAIEASYLAQGQAKRMGELESAIDSFEKMALRSFSKDTPIAISALVRLKKNAGAAHWILLAIEAGGTKISASDAEITVVTTKSPLGKSLLGAKQGEVIETDQDRNPIEYEILDVL